MPVSLTLKKAPQVTPQAAPQEPPKPTPQEPPKAADPNKHECLEALGRYLKTGEPLMLQRISDGALYLVHSCALDAGEFKVTVSREAPDSYRFTSRFGLREDALYRPMWR